MHIELSTIIYAIFNFSLLVVLLRIFLYKPVRKMMDTRQQIISESLEAAEQAQQQAAAAGEIIGAQLEQAKTEALEIVASARTAGDELKKQLLEEARAEALIITEDTRAALLKEREEAIIALRKEAAALAVSTAGRILSEEISTEQQQSLLQKYITKVGHLQ
ncbi:MAG: F0F1 ATP synthase subunit B [Clostridiales bacterium]|nr:F0F1 ATP synthase subunit B [Clostridiales bacterium]